MQIPLENINIGNLANDGTGDPLRVAFTKINNNFSSLTDSGAGGPIGAIQYKFQNFTAGSGSFTYDYTTNTLNISANIIPLTSDVLNIGTSTNYVNSIYVAGNALHLGNVNFVESNNVITFPVTGSTTGKASFAGLYNVSLQNNLDVGNTTTYSTSILTRNDNINQVIFQCDPTVFVSMIAKITSVDLNTQNTQTVTLNISKKQDNSEVHFVAHSTVFSPTAILGYNSDINFGVFRIMVTPIVNTTMSHTYELTIYH